MAKSSKTQAPAAAKAAPAAAKKATAAVKTAPAAAPIATPAPAAAPVVTRAQGTISAVAVGKAMYRVKADHTAAAWAKVAWALKDGPKPVQDVVVAVGTHPSPGGASGFVGYCVRRGYLVAVK